MRISGEDLESNRIEHLQRSRIKSDRDIRYDRNSPGIASGAGNKERLAGEATALVLSPSGALGTTVRNTKVGGWNQFSLAPFQSLTSAVEMRIAILSILDHGSKSNLQSAQLLICRELLSGLMHDCLTSVQHSSSRRDRPKLGRLR